MKTTINPADLLKLTARHKARTLSAMEEINCPGAYLEIIRRRLDYLRNDLVELAKMGMATQSATRTEATEDHSTEARKRKCIEDM